MNGKLIAALRHGHRAAVFLWLWLASALLWAAPLRPEQQQWLQRHPVIQYSANPNAAPASFVVDERHVGFAGDYMRLLGKHLGVRLEFVPQHSLEEAINATRAAKIDLVGPMARLPVLDGSLVFTSPLPGTTADDDSERALVIGVRGDWAPLVGILEQTHQSLAPAELAALRQRWQLAPAKASAVATGYSPQQLALVALTLTAAGLAISLLIVLWSARKRRGLARDIARSEAQFNAFFNASPAGMAILDRELRFVGINDTLAQMHGQPAAAHLGHSIEQMVPDLASVVAPLMREVMLTGRSVRNVEVTGHTPASDSQPRHWLASFFPVALHPERLPLGVGQVVLDIGDRKRAEIALRESENRLRNVSDHLPVAVFQYRADAFGSAGFTYMSEGIQPLLQISAEQALAAPAAFSDALHPDDRQRMAQVLNGEYRDYLPGEIEWTGRRNPALGAECWLQMRATREETSPGNFALSGVILDITQLTLAQQDVERSRAELRRLSAHREGIIEREHQRLAREFHDELGQVLTTARMQLQLLDRKLVSGPVDGASVAASIKDIESMVAEAYRSVKTIASDLRPAALNLGLTAAVEWLAARVLGTAGLRYAIRFDREADRLADDYLIALFRIVQESLTNIVRHAGAGNVSIELAYDGAAIRLAIADDGCGFVLEGIDRSSHFGLLGISERVAALAGTLEIDSAADAGTRLTVKLPYTAHPAQDE